MVQSITPNRSHKTINLITINGKSGVVQQIFVFLRTVHAVQKVVNLKLK